MAKEKKRGEQPPKNYFALATSIRPPGYSPQVPSGRADFLPQNDADVWSGRLSNGKHRLCRPYAGCQAVAIRRPKDRIGTFQT
jgi:hypothetical protein